MSEVVCPPAIEDWLDGMRRRFREEAPNLLKLFETYAGEALFGRRFISDDLRRLRAGAQVLEVGAGALLLSCQLVREGFRVVALEPCGSGFSHFDRMRDMVKRLAQEMGCCPEILDQPAERLDIVERFDYAFSVNVMEHVDDVPAVLATVAASLNSGATYRFTCPNYSFPYEPHFNIPTLFFKRLTGQVMAGAIFSSTRVPDPSGLWKSLNWIDVGQVRRIVRRLPGLTVTFNRAMLVTTVERVATDPAFAGRRPPSMRLALKALVRLQLHHLLRLLPAALQPVMDCRIEKVGVEGRG